MGGRYSLVLKFEEIVSPFTDVTRYRYKRFLAVSAFPQLYLIALGGNRGCAALIGALLRGVNHLNRF
jgi:hypothetical protein